MTAAVEIAHRIGGKPGAGIPSANQVLTIQRCAGQGYDLRHTQLVTLVTASQIAPWLNEMLLIPLEGALYGAAT